MSRRVVVLTATAAALLTGCVGTTPERPARSAPPTPPVAFAHAPAAPAAAEAAAPAAAPATAEFWRRFQDPRLDALVQQALASNPDLRIAAARLAEARALEEGSQGLGRPTLDATAGVARERSSGATATRLGVGLATQWELDLFGAAAAERRAAAASARAGEAELRAAQVALVGEIAGTYFQLRGVQAQLAVARQSLETQTAALKLVIARVEGGRGTGLDRERGRALVAGTAAQVPALDATQQALLLRLAVLTGRMPGASDASGPAAALLEPAPLPALAPTALGAVGDPAALLRRRPDVAAAEARLVAADAGADAARSRLWPQLTLSGNLGLNAGRLGDLGTAQAFVAGLGAQLAWSLIDNGQKQAAVKAGDARAAAAAAAFDRAVLVAIQETETALSAYTRAQRSSELLFEAASAADQAAQIARARFEVGVSDFGAVLEAERERLAARDRLVQAQTAAATGLVQVYRALAGGWGG
jgi:multidrug efflux system outer membrane protein